VIALESMPKLLREGHKKNKMVIVTTRPAKMVLPPIYF